MSFMDRECELALVARLRAADPGAFDVVYDEFNTRLFNFLARLSRRRDVAEDLLEETWLRFVAQMPRLRSDTSLGAWLFTVARNLHVSHCRSRLVEDSCAAGLIGLWPCGSIVPSPFASALAEETGRRLEAAIAALPVACREAVLLVAMEGLRPAEAAAVCGIAPETMRQRLSRARALLARSLDDSERRVLRTLEEATT
jgi:RNA polymerase sigma-70 factor, ECF subfamily